MGYYEKQKEYFERLEEFIISNEEPKKYWDLVYWVKKNYGYSYITIAKSLRILEAREMISWNRENGIILPLCLTENKNTPEGEKGE